jgi:hypothetical protein
MNFIIEMSCSRFAARKYKNTDEYRLSGFTRIPFTKKKITIYPFPVWLGKKFLLHLLSLNSKEYENLLRFAPL